MHKAICEISLRRGKEEGTTEEEEKGLRRPFCLPKVIAKIKDIIQFEDLGQNEM